MSLSIIYRLRLPELALLYISPAAESCLGQTMEDLLASPDLFAAAIPLADRERLLTRVARTGPNGGETTLDHTLEHKDGSRRAFKNFANVEPGGEFLSGMLLETELEEPTAQLRRQADLEEIRAWDERLRLASALAQAVEQKSFRLHYQPQVDLRSGCIAGVEALVRWRSRELGEVVPRVFLPVAVETGLIGAIGDWVLGEACRQRRQWLDEGLERFVVSVNLSAVEFLDAALPARVEHALREAGLDAQYLELELTESASMDKPEQSVAIMRKLKAMGVRLSIDDFGTGYSNLSYLKQFRVDKLKIDQTFIRDITRSAGDLTLARAMIQMAHSLRLRVIAEGVETQAQCSLLRSAGCDEIQGHFFSRPLAVGPVSAVLRDNMAQPLRAAPSGSARRSLLLLDDEVNITASLRRALQPRGYKVHTANTVEQAFEILAQNEVGVIVSDQRMPDLSGTEFLSQVKTMYPRSVRIILSGYTDLKTIADAINEGAIYKFITKPWDAELLELTLAEAFLQYEKHEAQRLLQESEQRFRVLFESSPAAIMIFDPDGRLSSCNAAAAALTGYPPEQQEGRHYSELVHDSDVESLKTRAARALQDQPQQLVVRVPHRDGSVRFAECNIARLLVSGQGAGLAAIAKDITEQVVAQRRLRESELRYRAIMDHNLDAVSVYDAHGRLTESNFGAEKMSGHSVVELRDQAYLQVIHPEDRAGVKETITRTMTNNDPQRMQFRFYNPSGEIAHADTVVVPLSDEGRVSGSITITRDISTYRKIESALRRSESELEVFFSQSLDGAFFMQIDEAVRWDDGCDKERALDYVFAHQRITRINQVMLAQYGMSEEQMLGLTPADLFAHDLPYGRELWRQCFDAGRLTTRTNECRGDGTPMCIEGDYICLYDDEGRITGHFGMQRELMALDRSAGEATAVVSGVDSTAAL